MEIIEKDGVWSYIHKNATQHPPTPHELGGRSQKFLEYFDSYLPPPPPSEDLLQSILSGKQKDKN